MLKLVHAFKFCLFASIEDLQEALEDHSKHLYLFVHLSLRYGELLDLLHLLDQHIVDNHLIILLLLVAAYFVRDRVTHLLDVKVHL